MMMIVVAGEALVDLVIEPDGAVTVALGGAPFNTARAAARLGGEVEFVGVLSRDRFGKMFTEQLEADGVGIKSAPRTDLPTTLAAAELDGAGAATYRFYFEGTSAALEAVDEMAVSAPGVLFTGGLGLVLEPMASTISTRIEHADNKTMVMVDLNCRPAAIANREVYMDRLDRVLARTDIVKASDEDLQYLFPGVASVEAAQRLLGRGPSAVIVTAGAEQTTLLLKGGVVAHVDLQPLTAPVIDTIGAGDTFDGAFLASWTAAGLSRDDITLEHVTAAVEAAHAAAAIVVARRGADPPWSDDVPGWR